MINIEGPRCHNNKPHVEFSPLLVVHPGHDRVDDLLRVFLRHQVGVGPHDHDVGSWRYKTHVLNWLFLWRTSFCGVCRIVWVPTIVQLAPWVTKTQVQICGGIKRMLMITKLAPEGRMLHFCICIKLWMTCWSWHPLFQYHFNAETLLVLQKA